MTLAVLKQEGPVGGRPEQKLSVGEIPDPPPPGPRQIQVEVTAFQLHPGDLMYPANAMPGGPVAVAGLEATGVVTRCGDDIAEPAPGTRVTFFPHPGAWQQLVNVDAAAAVAVPDWATDEVAAQLLVNSLTALQLRRIVTQHAGVGYNAVVLNHAAASSVGRLFTAVAVGCGIQTISIVRSDQRVDQLRRRFPDIPVITTSHRDWPDQVRDVAGNRPIHAAIDPVGGTTASALLELLSPGGSLSLYGQLDPGQIPLSAASVLAKGLTIHGMTIGRWLSAASVEQRSADVGHALNIAQICAPEFEVAKTYSVAEITDAGRHVLQAGRIGNVLAKF